MRSCATGKIQDAKTMSASSHGSDITRASTANRRTSFERLAAMADRHFLSMRGLAERASKGFVEKQRIVSEAARSLSERR